LSQIIFFKVLKFSELKKEKNKKPIFDFIEVFYGPKYEFIDTPDRNRPSACPTVTSRTMRDGGERDCHDVCYTKLSHKWEGNVNWTKS